MMKKEEAEGLDAYIRALVDNAPPLTDAQIATLRRIFTAAPETGVLGGD